MADSHNPSSLKIALAISILVSAAQAEICSPDGCGYSRIQAAIDSAGPGDKVVAESGTHSEILRKVKPITLHGLDTGEGRPVLGARNGSIVLANCVVIEGFEFARDSPLSCSLNMSSESNRIYLNSFPEAGSICTKGISLWNSSQPLNYQFESKIFRGEKEERVEVIRAKLSEPFTVTLKANPTTATVGSSTTTTIF